MVRWMKKQWIRSLAKKIGGNPPHGPSINISQRLEVSETNEIVVDGSINEWDAFRMEQCVYVVHTRFKNASQFSSPSYLSY